MSELSGYILGVFLLGFLVWWFWIAGGPPPKDAKRHKQIRKATRHRGPSRFPGDGL